MIGFLLGMAFLTGVEISRDASGYRIDFGPGSTCMPRLPQGVKPLPSEPGAELVRFEKGDSTSPGHVSGSARVLDEFQLAVRRSRQRNAGIGGVLMWTYKGAEIEMRKDESEPGKAVYGLEIVIGAQAIRFLTRTKAELPSPEAIVDSCGVDA